MTLAARDPRQDRPRVPCILLVSFLILIVTASAAAAAALTGRVTDPDGRPVAGARVIVSGPMAVPRVADTGATGAYRIDRLGPGTYEVRVVREGFAANPVRVTLEASGTRDVPVALRLSAVSDSVVVTASPVETDSSRVADSVSVLTASDLQAREIDTMADALRLLPGLSVAQTGTWGGITSVFPRGGDSDYTLVLVDGMPANDFGGGFDFAHLPIGGVQRIEVVRGPQSALFGSNAIGGVVQIVTRNGGAPEANASVEGGGLGTTRVSAGTSGSAGLWSWGASAERMASDGYTGLAPADGERVSNDNGEERAASGSLAWGHPGGTHWRADGRITWNDRGFPGPYGSNPTGSFMGVDRVSRGTTDDRQFGVRVDQPWAGGRAHQQVQVSYTDKYETFISPYGLSNMGTRRLDVRAQTDVALGTRGGASFGVDLQRERAVSTYITAGTTAELPIPRWVAGYFGELRYHLGDRLFLTGGVRLDDIRQAALPANADPYSPRPAFPPNVVLSANPKASVAYLLSGTGVGSGSWTKLHATAGTGIRPPDASEIAFTDNPHLKPERSRSLDAGIEQGLADGRVVLDATAFLNRYDDLIVAIGRSLQDYSQFQTDNISNARARGVELSGAFRLGAGLQARVSYTFLDTAILAVTHGAVAPAPFQVGDWLLRRPRHAGTIDLVWTRGRVTAFGDLGARGRTLDVDPSYGAFGGLFTNPGYAVLNAGGSVRIGRGLELFVRGTNLLDRRYEEVYGYPAAGRLAMAGLRFSTGR
ncbi:MAG: TonB-dependent receptor [Acidobacteriota bacterium]|nr:TonB-dependent receptor [Acidobacteriota bacterium]